jgi:hypothetical protein
MARKTNYHDKGQKDYKKSHGTEFHPPRSPFSAIFWSGKDVKEWNDYKGGWKNAKKQDRNR